MAFIMSAIILVGGVEVPAKYYTEMSRWCTELGVPETLAARLIQKESAWDYFAVGQNEQSMDFGLMQLNSVYISDFARRFNRGIPFDPFEWQKNLEIGLKLLADLYKSTRDWKASVIAYNMGLTGYRDWLEGRRRMPESTLKYLDFVFDFPHAL